MTDPPLEPGERILWQSRPGAARLFLSVVPGLLRDIVFLIVLGFALYAGWDEPALAPKLLCAALIVLFSWLLFRHLREAFGAGVSRYLITDRRMLLITPRVRSTPFVILPHAPSDRGERERKCWLNGKPRIGRITNGRATIVLYYEHYRQRSLNYADMVFRTDTVRLYAVTEPERAVELIGQYRR